MIFNKIISFIYNPDKIIKKAQEFGLTFIFHQFLNYFQIPTLKKIKYPIVNFKIKVRFNKFIYEWLKNEKGSKYCEIKILNEIVKPGQTIIDVGSHIGQFTLLFSKLVGKRGKVYSFEPDIIAYSCLNDNIILNKIKNTKLERFGLSNINGKAKLYYNENGGNSLSSILRSITHKTTNYINIDLITIDDYCIKNNIIPDVIKIDVEGAEDLVIEGAKMILKKYHPWVLLEFHGNLMSEIKKNKSWQIISSLSKEIIFINGNSKKLKYGVKINSLPHCNNFHVLIKY